jgi:hypothetical protein
MSWLLVGEIRRVTQRPADAPGSKFQVQVLAEETMRSGEAREAIFTLGTDEPARFQENVGHVVAIQASPYPRKDGGLGVSLAPGAQVRRLDKGGFSADLEHPK